MPLDLHILGDGDGWAWIPISSQVNSTQSHTATGLVANSIGEPQREGLGFWLSHVIFCLACFLPASLLALSKSPVGLSFPDSCKQSWWVQFYQWCQHGICPTNPVQVLSSHQTLLGTWVSLCHLRQVCDLATSTVSFCSWKHWDLGRLSNLPHNIKYVPGGGHCHLCWIWHQFAPQPPYPLAACVSLSLMATSFQDGLQGVAWIHSRSGSVRELVLFKSKTFCGCRSSLQFPAMSRPEQRGTEAWGKGTALVQ